MNKQKAVGHVYDLKKLRNINYGDPMKIYFKLIYKKYSFLFISND
ncbi:hypothetical protein [Staphylococcus agnetis]|nr:hypothetical protein [Staphylococcus agnetis]